MGLVLERTRTRTTVALTLDRRIELQSLPLDMNVRRSKRLAARRPDSPFDVPDICDAVLDYAGSGQAIFFACVNRCWASAVARRPGEETIFHQIATYPNRIAWAWRLHHCSQLCWSIGMWAPPAVVRRYAARCAAIPNGLARLKDGIVRSDRPALLEYLQRRHALIVYYTATLEDAVDFGNYTVAQWCRTQAGPAFPWDSTDRAMEALRRDRIQAFTWHQAYMNAHAFDWGYGLVTAVQYGGAELARQVLDHVPRCTCRHCLFDGVLAHMCTIDYRHLRPFLDLGIGHWSDRALAKTVTWMRGRDAAPMRRVAECVLEYKPELRTWFDEFLS